MVNVTIEPQLSTTARPDRAAVGPRARADRAHADPAARTVAVEAVCAVELALVGAVEQVDDGWVMMRTTKGFERVDVLYRRIDDDFILDDRLGFEFEVERRGFVRQHLDAGHHDR